MYLKELEISGFKSFAKKTAFTFHAPISAIVGPNGSGKSNVAEAIRFVLGEQSMKSLRGKKGEDLIWNGSGTVGRSNKASVAVTFDNSKRELDIDYDEVVVKRQVFRDGTNSYFINGTQVRLRDIIELLAKVNIGATGHHIISQGEADRILNASSKERKTMIEEALGLKIYQWKIEESEKKLQKTEENIKQVESVRKEIAPHINFLKRQVEKIEKAKEMQDELQELYLEYLKREAQYIEDKENYFQKEKEEPERELEDIEREIAKAKEKLDSEKENKEEKNKLLKLESDLSHIREQKDNISRELGRVEGMILFEEKRIKKAEEKGSEAEQVPKRTVNAFTEDVQRLLDEAERAGEFSRVKTLLARMRETLELFVGSIRRVAQDHAVDTADLENLKKEKDELAGKLKDVEEREKELQETYDEMKQALEEEKDTSRDTERKMFEMMARKSELSSHISLLRNEEQQFEKDKNAFNEEVKEGSVLIGSSILKYKEHDVAGDDVRGEDRDKQEARRKKIEKIKIKLEDMGAGASDEVMKEYEETRERDEFFAREIVDLEKSAESLRELIRDLTEKLDQDFKEGIQKINKQFQEFFALMFGGGTARLVVVEHKKRKRRDTETDITAEMLELEIPPEEEAEEGIDINISLPRKKIKGLQMLSGGERALTSIALIFAVSQVNPPPFLVLDETDAALDEANSKKYGEMLQTLSNHSQLIVVTHNRTTMSHAGILYGVTMGKDAVSQVLSVKFDEASAFAK